MLDPDFSVTAWVVSNCPHWGQRPHTEAIMPQVCGGVCVRWTFRCSFLLSQEDSGTEVKSCLILISVWRPGLSPTVHIEARGRTPRPPCPRCVPSVLVWGRSVWSPHGLGVRRDDGSAVGAGRWSWFQAMWGGGWKFGWSMERWKGAGGLWSAPLWQKGAPLCLKGALLWGRARPFCLFDRQGAQAPWSFGDFLLFFDAAKSWWKPDPLAVIQPYVIQNVDIIATERCSLGKSFTLTMTADLIYFYINRAVIQYLYIYYS